MRITDAEGISSMHALYGMHLSVLLTPNTQLVWRKDGASIQASYSIICGKHQDLESAAVSVRTAEGGIEFLP